MKILELAKKLKKVYDQHGDIEVMFTGPNLDTDPYSIGDIALMEASEGEFPEDWNMPEGFKFVRLAN